MQTRSTKLALFSLLWFLFLLAFRVGRKARLTPAPSRAPLPTSRVPWWSGQRWLSPTTPPKRAALPPRTLPGVTPLWTFPQVHTIWRLPAGLLHFADG